MPKRIMIELSAAQRQELVAVRDHHPKPFVRERAAAVLKVASGKSLTAVAEHGLLKRHEPETVHLWVKRYLQAGVAGWQIKRGRGRKSKFSPSAGSSSDPGTRDAP